MESPDQRLGFAESPIQLPSAPAYVNVQSHQLRRLTLKTPKLSAGSWQRVNPLALSILLAITALILSNLVFPVNILILASGISMVCASQILLHIPGVYWFIGNRIASGEWMRHRMRQRMRQPKPTAPEPFPCRSTEDKLMPDTMPMITLLIPLYKEAGMVNQINQMLQKINYPAHKMDVLILLEQGDQDTLRASQKQVFHQPTRIITTPSGSPRTKPRACNNGLFLAKGTIIGIYDAEDLPHPDQLLEVAETFANGPAKLACLQAPLNINGTGYHPLKNLFALEYKMLFNFLLPSLINWDLPMPLSGSSNFFRRDVLETIGHWDAYNLTEDADIGMRLARSGYTIGLLSKPTMEMAPDSVRDWFFQRTRWLTGFLQTYLVHMREPKILMAELGLAKFVTFNFLYSARLASGIAHCACLYWISFHLETLKNFLVSNPVGWLSIIAYSNIIFIICGLWIISSTWRQRLYSLLLPLYWLVFVAPLILAIYNLIRRNFKWYKTPHLPELLANPLE